MDEPAKKAVFLSLINKGTPELPRWMISDQYNRVWSDHSSQFVEDHRKGTLFANYSTAAWDIHEMLVEEYRQLPTYHFEVPIKVRIYSATPLDEKVVAAWCQKACRMLLDANGCGYGPLDGTFGLVVADWRGLKKMTTEGGQP